MIALVDVNAFYYHALASFMPQLVGQPVVVLSNNDGNVVARSDAAKAMGIQQGTPLFMLDEARKTGLQVFSSNYTLFGCLSARTMTILNRFVEDVEVYSIDEAFLDLTGYDQTYPDLGRFGQEIRTTIDQWLRLPVCVGIAPTKTLAKVANRLAKKQPACNGVCLLESPQQITEALDTVAVGDLWGIGQQYEQLLTAHGVHTAAQLARLPDDWIRQFLNVTGLRLVYELRGTPCHDLEIEPPPRQSMCCAPSFGRLIADLDTIKQALSTYVTRLAGKLRQQGSVASSITVFIHTNRFRKNAKQYYRTRSILLPAPTSSTAELNNYAQALLSELFAFGYEYKKIGVYVGGLLPASYQQEALFTRPRDPRLAKLDVVVDDLNQRFGRDRVRLAAMGYDKSWHLKQRWPTPCYTTRWSDIIQVK